MALRSQISSIIANQLGNIQGQLEARILDEVVVMQSKFTNSCPNQELLLKIINIRNNLIAIVIKFQNLVKKFDSIPATLSPPIQIANVIIQLLKSNPTPLAIGTPPGPAGGLIVAQTAGFVTAQADRLQKLTLLLEALQDDVTTIKDLVQGIRPSLDNVRQLLENVNISIDACIGKLSGEDADKARKLLAAVNPPSNTGSEGTEDQSYEHRGSNGIDYVLSIQTVITSTNIAPRRVAIAKNLQGITMVRGEASFSSSTQVLLDELKFKIDNQLL